MKVSGSDYAKQVLEIYQLAIRVQMGLWQMTVIRCWLVAIVFILVTVHLCEQGSAITGAPAGGERVVFEQYSSHFSFLWGQGIAPLQVEWL